MENRVLELLKESNALMEGHFLLSSGKHSDQYVQCAKLLQYPDKAEEVCQYIKEKLDGVEIDLVCGPAMGGIIISYELARALGVPAIFTERVENEMTLRRGFEIEEGQKVLIVEDVITTGKSSKETIKVLEDLGAEVVGIAALVDRTGGKNIGLNLYPAISLDIKIYEPEECPMCERGIDVEKPGSRKMK